MRRQMYKTSILQCEMKEKENAKKKNTEDEHKISEKLIVLIKFKSEIKLFILQYKYLILIKI